MTLARLFPLSASATRLWFRFAFILALLFAGTSAAVAQTATSTTLAMTSGTTVVTSASLGTILTLTATVTAGTSYPAHGQVEFCDAAAGTAAACTFLHNLGTVQMIQSGYTGAGTAVYRLAPALGTHNYYAAYVANTTYSTSTSAVQVYTTTGSASTATAISQSGSVGNYSLTATVTGSLGVPPAGSVSFMDESADFNPLGSGTLIPGTSTASFGAAIPSYSQQSPFAP